MYNMKKGERIVFICILLSLSVLAFNVPSASAQVTFTGNVPADFTGSNVIVVNDQATNDVGLPGPPNSPYGVSGWDMVAIYLSYDHINDRMYVGFDFNGKIGGDADGDGDPNGTSSWLAGFSGVDNPNLSGSESICMLIDTDNDGHANVAIGVNDADDITKFAAYQRTANIFFLAPYSSTYWSSSAISGCPVTLYNSPTGPESGKPDLEFYIDNFSDLPGFSFDPGESFKFGMLGFAGSQDDDGIGEDLVPGNTPTTVEFFSDYGDAPDTYHTTDSQNGAHHVITSGIQLGSSIDGDEDGQPSVGADGDDTDSDGDDEDGVIFTSNFVVGLSATIQVTVTGSGYLNAWFDWNKDGDWADAGEHAISDQSLTTGTHSISVSVPSGATLGTTYVRFRYSSTSGLSYDGPSSPPAPDGEVEDYTVEILPQIDWGDAPESGMSYPTTSTNNGARHIIDFSTYLGSGVDSEDDGQPTVGADGDDTNGSDDEDGVVFSTLRRGQSATATVTTSSAGVLDAWIDFNDDGDWDDSGERIFNGTVISSAGSHVLGFTVPANATPTSQTYARFRFSSSGVSSYNGEAANGEVEDYVVEIEDYLDFGDAPDSYSTTLSNSGARHFIDGVYYLGAAVGDMESDGQPSAGADGDDIDGNDDEDGVTFNNQLVQGRQANITVVASVGTGYLDAWVDFNADGDWNDSGEKIFSSQALSAGSNSLSFTVPINATVTDTTYARFRFSSSGGLSFTGAADDGEVEDYVIDSGIEESPLDFGDAPDPNYPTLRSNNGARHNILASGNPTMGSTVDDESDGQPTTGADGDDTDGSDDEDGVTFNTSLVPGETATLTVTASSAAAGVLNAWIDFNGDGDWNDSGERIATNVSISAGGNAVINYSVPAGAVQDTTYARFRFSSESDLSPTGLAQDGEVEDYLVVINELDYGDAPDPLGSTAGRYPTLQANNGARHIILSSGNPYLGSTQPDNESDGQPTSGADGDDNNGVDDEDGVSFAGDLIPGKEDSVQVTAGTTGGVLNAWIDFNNDGDWNDAGEQIASNLSISASTSLFVKFTVPSDAAGGYTYSRFRFSTQTGLGPTGLANNGEVEDYRIYIQGLDFGDAPESGTNYPTTLSNNGARHTILKTNNPTMGSLIDGESDGQPTSGADGDDTNGSDDEDGVTFSTMIQGQSSTITVVTTTAGFLNAWIDWNNDGDWGDTGEHVYNDVSLIAGTNNLTINVPFGASSGQTYARFRFSSTSGLSYTGLADDGEVEDYRITVTAANPSIDIEKSTNGEDADTPTGPQIPVDSTVTWEYIIRNTGNVPLSNIKVTDNHSGVVPSYISGDDGDNILELNETWIYRDDSTAIEGQYANQGRVQGEYYTTVVADSDSSHYIGYLYASIGDTVWYDIDRDGLQDASEVGLDSITVRLYRDVDGDNTPEPGGDDGSSIADTLTDANGRYIFEYLAPGDYFVEFVLPSKYIFSPPNQGSDDAVDSDADTLTGVTDVTTLTSGEADVTWDCGMYLKSASIGDYVWDDVDMDGVQDAAESGIDSALVKLYLSDSTFVDSTLTDSTGSYSFIDLTPDDYYLEFILPDGYVFTLPDEGSNDQADSDADTTSGTTPLITLEAGEIDTSWDAGMYLKNGSIGDYVWHDADGDGKQDWNEKGIKGVLVKLQVNEVTIASQITNKDGWYDFTGLAAGKYKVDVSDNTLPKGYFITTNNEPMYVNLSPGEDFNDADFGYRPHGNIGDYVWEDLDWDGIQDGNESGIPDITVVLYDTSGNLIATEVTNWHGLYMFTGLEPGVYIVDVDGSDEDMPEDYVCTTHNEPMTVNLSEGEDFLDADFGYMAPKPPLGAIGDYTWHDSDWDGQQDKDEDDLPFVYVFLYKDGVKIDSIKTDFFGGYHFTGLEPGKYVVEANRYGPGPKGVWRMTTVGSFSVDLNPGEVFLDADFGYAYPDEGFGKGRRWLLARYQPWFGDAENDSTLRHWKYDYLGGQADTSLFNKYDSYDPDLWEYHILLAWACGIDGFAVDWYGKESYENPGIKGLLDKADSLYNIYSDKGFNFEIAVSYNEMAYDRLDTNFIYIADSLLPHPAYWGTRRHVRRPVFLWNDTTDTVYFPHDYRACADTTLPPDVFLLWNGTEQFCFDPVDVCYPWIQPLNNQWDPDGQEWGESYLDTTYWRMNYLPDPGDLIFALGAVWPGFDDRDWSLGHDDWMDRQDTLVYHWTWEKVHDYSYPLPMPWCMIETWNDFNQATEIEPSTDWDYIFDVMTRNHARRFKSTLPPDSVGVENMGLLVPQHVYQARIAAKIRPSEAAAINSKIEEALDLFFEREHLKAVSKADQAAGIAPKPITIKAVGDTFVQISWQSADRANSYNVYYSTDRSRFEPCAYYKPEKVSAGDVTQYTLYGLNPGTKYYIAVTAADTNLGLYANDSWFENTITGAGVKSFTTSGATGVSDNDDLVPKEFRMSQNFPNPFNPITTIEYALPEAQHVVLKIYDVQGREVKTLVDEYQQPGVYRVKLEAAGLASGVYFCRLISKKYNKIMKMMLIK